MTFNYTSLQNVALNQIADKGRTVCIVYKTVGRYDAMLDAIDGDSQNTVEVKALVRNYNNRDVDGTLIQASDKEFVIAASGIDKPRVNDIIDDDGEYSIVRIVEIKPGDAAIIYKLQARKG